MGFFGGLLRRNVPREPVDPFAPDPYAALGSRDLPPHSPPWKQPHPHSWAAWLASFPPSPSKAIHAVLRALDVVVGDAGGKILPVVNEGFVKTPYSKSKGDVEEAIRVPVRKTVKDG